MGMKVHVSGASGLMGRYLSRQALCLDDLA